MVGGGVEGACEGGKGSESQRGGGWESDSGRDEGESEGVGLTVITLRPVLSNMTQ